MMGWHTTTEPHAPTRRAPTPPCALGMCLLASMLLVSTRLMPAGAVRRVHTWYWPAGALSRSSKMASSWRLNALGSRSWSTDAARFLVPAASISPSPSNSPLGCAAASAGGGAAILRGSEADAEVRVFGRG